MERLRELLLGWAVPGYGRLAIPTSTRRSAGDFGNSSGEGGRFGVVVPRSALSAAGGARWREEILAAVSSPT